MSIKKRLLILEQKAKPCDQSGKLFITFDHVPRSPGDVAEKAALDEKGLKYLTVNIVKAIASNEPINSL